MSLGFTSYLVVVVIQSTPAVEGCKDTAMNMRMRAVVVFWLLKHCNKFAVPLSQLRRRLLCAIKQGQKPPKREAPVP